MHAAVGTNDTTPKLPITRWLVIVVVLLLAVASGCNRLRLPAIDPTGSCLFAPLPTTTTLALPGAAKEGCGCFSCLRGLGTCTLPLFNPPEPAFPEPAAPPACAVPAPAAAAGPQLAGGDDAVVPSAPCNGSCQHGPPAVLLGEQCKMKDLLHLPDRGKRGCILLSPQKIVAPVGGEVVLLSGICGTDGYLQTGEPLEWMLTPESVGTFIQVGDDDPGLLHQLVGTPEAKKKDPSYALGVTSTKRTLITRGNTDRRDDVQLERGQTWITISSPSEGTSKVTVLAPESECWDQRKATATIYWVDARWQFPGPQRVPAGTPVQLTTRVTRAEGSLPARGWKVRYEILQPDLATFAATNGSPVVETIVDDSGNATAELIPNPGTSGNAVINIQVIRPSGVSDNMPALTLGRGQAFVTWSSPRLELDAGAPSVATYNEPFEVVANVSNPGDQAADNVQVEVNIPAGAQVTSADSFAQVLPNAVLWNIPSIPPQQQLDLFISMAAPAPVVLNYQARAEGGLFASDTVRVDIYQPSLALTVAPREDRYQAGESAVFDIAVENTGDRPMTGVHLRATGSPELIHEATQSPEIANDKEGPLQPGEVWRKAVTFTPLEGGRRCLSVEVTADGGQYAQQEACITVINRVPPTPAVTATVNARAQMVTGETILVTGRVINTGEVPLRNVQASMVFEPQLRPLGGSQGPLDGSESYNFDTSRIGQYLIAWTIPLIQPGEPIVLEGRFEAVQPSPRSRVIFTVTSAEGASASADDEIEILPGAAPEAPTQPPPSLPPLEQTPEVPLEPLQPRQPPASDQPSGPVAPPLPRSDAAPASPLAIDVLQQDISPRVGELIRYQLSVENPSNQVDGAVQVRFKLPPGITIERITATMYPELGQFTRFGDYVILEDIKSLRPGESLDYEIVMSSNQAQTYDLVFEAASRLNPAGVSEVVTTRVAP